MPTGFREMKSNLDKLGRKLERDLRRAIKDEANAIAKRAKNEFVPVDEGDLRASIHVEEVKEPSADSISFSIVAGGDRAPYAVAVHEHPSEHSPPSWKNTTVTFHPSGHGPKFIERPLRDASTGMADRIAAKVKAS